MSVASGGQADRAAIAIAVTVQRLRLLTVRRISIGKNRPLTSMLIVVELTYSLYNGQENSCARRLFSIVAVLAQ